jgi:ABC-type multidrug transport system ATPase subunit
VSEPLIRLRGLRKSYGRRRGLSGVDLEIHDRQIFGLVGPDGAGKSTLLRALAGLLEVQAGEASVLGFDLRGDVTALKARTGYVPQVFSLHRDLSVAENLAFTARLHRLPADEAAHRIAELLERIALTAFADRVTGALSGGMKQKLALANALLPRPALLVLDEPTAGVDVVARGEIWSLLVEARAHALVMLSTSYMDEAARCDRLAYLDEGRVVATGTPDELRGAVGLEVYRAWSNDARAVAAAARTLPYVAGARATGASARVEVRRQESPGAGRVLRDLSALAGGAVRFAEQLPADMEATLRGLAGGHA